MRRESLAAASADCTLVVLPSKGLDREAYDRQLIDELRKNRVDLVCLAGYMRILSGHFIREFHQRILNIHPSLLPAFPGLDAQHQALEHGVKFSGCTVHFVEEGWTRARSSARRRCRCSTTTPRNRSPRGS